MVAAGLVGGQQPQVGGQAAGRGGADAGGLGLVDGVDVEAGQIVATPWRTAGAGPGDAVGGADGGGVQGVAEQEAALVLGDERQMVGGHRLGQQAGHGVAAGQTRRVQQRLAERRPGVAALGAQRAHVGVGVPVQQRHRAAGAHVAQEVAVRGLVAAAEHDGERARRQGLPPPPRPAAPDRASRSSPVTTSPQIDASAPAAPAHAPGARGVGGQPVQVPADLRRRRRPRRGGRRCGARPRRWESRPAPPGPPAGIACAEQVPHPRIVGAVAGSSTRGGASGRSGAHARRSVRSS